MERRSAIRPMLRPAIRPALRSPFTRGGGFSPLSAFAGNGAGLWLDQPDISTGFQDSAGTTPQTASGQPTGKRLDKSGRANHVSQSSASARPEYDLISGIASDFCDGTDDGYSTATFVATTLTSNMDCFVAVKRSNTTAGVLCSPATGTVFCYWQNAGGGASMVGVGASATQYVNNVSIADTPTAMHNAMTVGSWVVYEARNLDLSAWTAFRVGMYTGFMPACDVGGLILCPAQTTANRDKLRKWLGARVGLSL